MKHRHLFFMLGWPRCYFHKKCVGTCYAKHVFLHPVGSASHVVSWFMTRFESSGAHGCDEQWNTRNIKVYTSSGLPEDNSPTSSVRQWYYDCLGRDPLYLSFYMLSRVGFTWMVRLVTVVPNPDSISTCPIYKI
jgi:hypothetical protein